MASALAKTSLLVNPECGTLPEAMWHHVNSSRTVDRPLGQALATLVYQ